MTNVNKSDLSESTKLPKLDYVSPNKQRHADMHSQLQQNSSQQMAQNEETLKQKMTHGFIEPPNLTEKEMLSYYDELSEKKAQQMNNVLRMAKYNPLVPLGCLATMGVLMNGIWAMRKNDRAKSQRMMRYRVAAQGTTIIALVVGTMASSFFYGQPNPNESTANSLASKTSQK
jgi:hypothetical protein